MMDDLISRQAAIDQLHQSYNLFDAEDRLKELPSTTQVTISKQTADLKLQLSNDIISRQAIEWHDYLVADGNGMYHEEKVAYKSQVDDLPSAQPDLIAFTAYQIEWLTSHCDLELEPGLEEWVVRFLHDTANCYMMDLDRKEHTEAR